MNCPFCLNPMQPSLQANRVYCSEKCRERARDRRYSTSNRERDRRNAQTWKSFMDLIKTTNPCQDCGKFYPAICMDFDHRDPSQKSIGMSKFRTKPRAAVTFIRELKKCDVVCSNCHRLRTEVQRKAGLIPTGRKNLNFVHSSIDLHPVPPA